MSTDLTTTLMCIDDDSKVGLRFCRTVSGGMRVYGMDGLVALYFGEADAIMLRDWLNDEWPVEGVEGAVQYRCLNMPGADAEPAQPKSAFPRWWTDPRYEGLVGV